MLAAGAAYRDYATPEELQAERDAAQQAGPTIRLQPPLAGGDRRRRCRFESEGRQGVVRLLMPREGQFVLDDWSAARSSSIGPASRTMSSSGPTARASIIWPRVVDDHDMQISHVIRAEEHLSNTPRQVFMFERLGYELPQFAHLPYVAEPGSKNKLSKRKLDKYLKNPEFRGLFNHGLEVAAVLDEKLKRFVEEKGLPDADASDRHRYAEALRRRLPVNIDTLSDDPLEQRRLEDVIRHHTLDLFEEPAIVALYQKATKLLMLLGVERNPETFNPVLVDFYEQVGYLPDAILNYLITLGWSLDDKTEEFSREEMLRYFSLERVNKAPASFDPKKLQAFQARAMQHLSTNERLSLVVKLLERAGWDVKSESNVEVIRQIVGLAGDRIKVAGDIVDFDHLFTTDTGFPYDPQAFEKRISKPAGAIELLAKLRAVLAEVEPFTAERLEPWMHEWVAAQGIKIGDVVHAVRVAVTGKAVGFGLFDTLAILGRERCLARIECSVGPRRQSGLRAALGGTSLSLGRRAWHHRFEPATPIAGRSGRATRPFKTSCRLLATPPNRG